MKQYNKLYNQNGEALIFIIDALRRFLLNHSNAFQELTQSLRGYNNINV
jgi:hypothetical protein